MKINIHQLEKCSRLLGPNKRYLIWFQGCDKNCKGCMSQLSRDLKIKNEIEVDDIVEDILKQDVEGITISGGEPFLQIDGLTELVSKVKSKGLGVIVYTGYLYDDIKHLEVMRDIDILIDGPYIDELNMNNDAYRGSSNQRIIALSDRYDLSEYQSHKRRAEITFDRDNIHLIGVPSREVLKVYYQMIEKLS